MKSFCLIPLLFLSACSTAPKVSLRPQQPPLATAAGNSAIRYPEVVRAYHFGRYVDPNDSLVMHKQHTVFRVEENTRWDLHPAAVGKEIYFPAASAAHDAAFHPTPVNDAILAEVNSQRLATAQIMGQARTLTAALGQFQAALQQTRTNLQATAILRAAVSDLKHRLDALEATPAPPPISTTNTPSDMLGP
jgi:hypothetical protein